MSIQQGPPHPQAPQICFDKPELLGPRQVPHTGSCIVSFPSGPHAPILFSGTAPARLSRRWRSWTLKVSADAGGPVPARGFLSGSVPSLFWPPKSRSASQGPCPPLPACSCPLPRQTLPVWPRPIYSYGTGARKADWGLGPNKQSASGRGSQAGRVGGQERCLGTGWGSSRIGGSAWQERGSLPAPLGPTSLTTGR